MAKKKTVTPIDATTTPVTPTVPETPEVPETPVTPETPEVPSAADITAPTTSAPLAESKPLQAEAAETAPEVPVSVARLRGLIQNYRSAVGTADLTLPLQKFLSIVDFCVMTKERVVLDEFYKFFVSERSGMLAHNIVLAGIQQLEPSRRLKTAAFYSVFYGMALAKASGNAFMFDMNAVQTVIGSETLVRFLITKLNR